MLWRVSSKIILIGSDKWMSGKTLETVSKDTRATSFM